MNDRIVQEVESSKNLPPRTHPDPVPPPQLPKGSPPPDPRQCRGSDGTIPTLTVTPAEPGLLLHFTGTPNTQVVVALGASTATFGPRSLPFDLTALGAPGCQLLVSIDLPLPSRTDDGGQGTFRLPLSRPPGTRLFAQVILFDAEANAAGLTSSNARPLPAGR